MNITQELSNNAKVLQLNVGSWQRVECTDLWLLTSMFYKYDNVCMSKFVCQQIQLNDNVLAEDTCTIVTCHSHKQLNSKWQNTLHSNIYTNYEQF